MKKLFFISIFALLATGCSDLGSIDNSENDPSTGQNPENNEVVCTLYYTTTNNQIFRLQANLISDVPLRIINHTYENGVGIVELNNHITHFGKPFTTGVDVNLYQERILKSIIIPDCVTSLAVAAFEYCDNLESVTLPESLEIIEASAFYGCNNMIDITIPNSVKFIGDGAFHGCDKLTSINIPYGVTTIGERTFEDCSSLKNIAIPDSVISIGYGAFSNCESATSLTIGNGVKTIGKYAFSSCNSLTNVVIPNGVSEIHDGAFGYCHSLRSVDIPKSITTIGEGAFESCSNLTTVYCRSTTPPNLGLNAFETILENLTAIYVPSESAAAYKLAENWSYYKDYIFGYDFE